jgi:DNA-binding transcriptional LysR family regulator
MTSREMARRIALGELLSAVRSQRCDSLPDSLPPRHSGRGRFISDWFAWAVWVYFARVELRHLRSFLAVADRLNFSQAALALHITQPALSRQIRDLEAELGCRLFERRPQGVTLTAEGEALRTRAAPLVEEADRLTRDMQARGRDRSSVAQLAHFGTFLALYLAPFLQRLHRRHPRWQIELVELVPAQALQRLSRGEIDAAATGRPDPSRLRGLESRVIWRQTPLIALPAVHPLAKRRKLHLRDLAAERLLVWDEDQFPGFGAPFLAACRVAGFEPKSVQTTGDLANAFSAVARDGVVTYVGRLAGQVPAPGIALVPLAEGELDMPTVLVWRPDSPAAGVLTELADLLAAQPPAGQ